MKACPEVTVITVTYQSSHLLDALSATLSRFANVCIVDNASSDDTVKQLTSALPDARLVKNKINRGFGAANNTGAQFVTTPYMLLLNPDADIHPHSVRLLIQTLQQYPQAGIVAPQVWLDNGKAQMSYKEAFFEPTSAVPYIVPQGICSTKWLTGCCLLVRTDAYRKIGGFDEGFFLYYEDDDLCLRMHHAQWECLLQPDASARHIGGGGSAPSWRIELFKHYHYALSRRRMIYKYLGQKAVIAYRAKTLLAALPALAIYGVLLRKKYVLRWLGWGYSCLMPLKPY